MIKRFLIIVFCCTGVGVYKSFAVDMQVQSMRTLRDGIQEVTYGAVNFSAVVRVIKIPLDTVDIALVPAIGQRQAVSAIAQRVGAFIALNGANYRRGGNYNGNRVNLCYCDKHLYADVQAARGAFGWNSKMRNVVIDTVLFDIQFLIDNVPFPVHGVNQPRIAGQGILYTDVADVSLLAYTPGTIVFIDKNLTVVSIGTVAPVHIEQGCYAYQMDVCPEFIHVGMKVVCNGTIRSLHSDAVYNECDFILGGSGLLIHNGISKIDDLYDEFSQGAAIVHCADEVAADFSTRAMQEWLIELRHPRTALGVTDNNEICIVVVDGRQQRSEGLSLKELADFMQQLGCIHALNLGGGGCTALCIDGQLANSPSTNAGSSVGEERPVSEAICFF